MDREAAMAMVRRFYDDVWNEWNFELAEDLLDPNLRFRGSLGTEVEGFDGFVSYMAMVRAAFPDFRNTVEELVAQEDRVAARLTYEGTHRGEILGAGPTGRRVRYSGAAFFRFSADRIVSVWVLGDLHSLRTQLAAPRPSAVTDSISGGGSPANRPDACGRAPLSETPNGGFASGEPQDDNPPGWRTPGVG